MYESHFKLREQPFSLTPNTQFFFNQYSHSQALNTLVFALESGDGFVKIVGEVGTGKTIICRKLLSMLGEKYCAAYIPNPYLTPLELRVLFAEEIGAAVTPDMPTHQLLSVINQRLMALAEQGRQVVMIIDEAQAMSAETLESLRLLTNLETEKRKLLQVVLFGQPELDMLLARDDLRQLRQRIVYQDYLQPCGDSQALRHYLHYRLQAAGYQGGDLFSRAAISLLFRASGGVPRLVNILAHKSMVCAWGCGQHRVNARHVARAVGDTGESTAAGKFWALRWALLWPLAGAAALAASLLLPLPGALL